MVVCHRFVRVLCGDDLGPTGGVCRTNHGGRWRGASPGVDRRAQPGRDDHPGDRHGLTLVAINHRRPFSAVVLVGVGGCPLRTYSARWSVAKTLKRNVER